MEALDQKTIEPIKNAQVPTEIAIASLALNMALKYHDVTVCRDGTMYQQYKLEGKNLKELGLDDVFETAKRMEEYLLRSSERFEEIILAIEKEENNEEEAAAP